MSAFSKLRPGWVLGGAVLALVASFAIVFAIIFGYAILLGVQARGAPDPAAINRFARDGSITWLSIAGTALGVALASWLVARRTRPNQLANASGVGVVVAVVLLLSLLGGANPGWTLLRTAEALAVSAAVGYLDARSSKRAHPDG